MALPQSVTTWILGLSTTLSLPPPGDPLPNKKADSSLVRTVTRKTEYYGSSFHKRAASNLHT